MYEIFRSGIDFSIFHRFLNFFPTFPSNYLRFFDILPIFSIYFQFFFDNLIKNFFRVIPEINPVGPKIDLSVHTSGYYVQNLTAQGVTKTWVD